MRHGEHPAADSALVASPAVPAGKLKLTFCLGLAACRTEFERGYLVLCLLEVQAHLGDAESGDVREDERTGDDDRPEPVPDDQRNPPRPSSTSRG